MAKIKWDKVPDRIIWNRIKSLRKSMGLNQTQLAVGVGVSVPTIWMLEQGYDERTTKETKQKFADFFKCDIDDLFPVEMVGNKPKEYPKEKTIVKMQFFEHEGKK
ncbi:hypothetical protein ES702_06746 [subsurface metagenome]